LTRWRIFCKEQRRLKEEIERRESYKDLSDTELDESLEKSTKEEKLVSRFNDGYGASPKRIFIVAATPRN